MHTVASATAAGDGVRTAWHAAGQACCQTGKSRELRRRRHNKAGRATPSRYFRSYSAAVVQAKSSWKGLPGRAL